MTGKFNFFDPLGLFQFKVPPKLISREPGSGMPVPPIKQIPWPLPDPTEPFRKSIKKQEAELKAMRETYRH